MLDIINESKFKGMYSNDIYFERFSNLMDNEKVSKRRFYALNSFRELLPSGTISPKIFNFGTG